MKLKEDQSRIKELLKDTITLLCKNGLQYKAGFSVEALIGITLDEEDVFLVNIKESVRNEDAKDKSSGVEVTVERRKTADGSESEQEGTPNRRNQTLISKHSRKRPPDGSPPPFDQASPAKQTRFHSEHDDASNTSSTQYQSEQSKDSAFNIKSEPNDDEDELVFVKQEGGNDYSSCSQGNPFPLGQITPGQQNMPHMSQTMLNPNFAFDPQTGATSSDSLPGISSWASSQAGGLDASGQNISAIPGSQGSQPGRWILSPGSFKCPHCEKRYKAKQNLEAHLRTRHRAGPGLQCVCGKKFNWPSMLSKHKSKCPEAVAEGLQDIAALSPTRPEVPRFNPFDPTEILRSMSDVPSEILRSMQSDILRSVSGMALDLRDKSTRLPDDDVQSDPRDMKKVHYNQEDSEAKGHVQEQTSVEHIEQNHERVDDQNGLPKLSEEEGQIPRKEEQRNASLKS